jgi:hypothetical protein
MLMEMFMKEIGQMIKHREGEIMNIWMEQSMLVIGRRIDSMDMELNLGLMVLDMKEITRMVKSME